MAAIGRSLLPKLLPDGAEKRNTNWHRPLRSGTRGGQQIQIEGVALLLAALAFFVGDIVEDVLSPGERAECAGWRRPWFARCFARRLLEPGRRQIAAPGGHVGRLAGFASSAAEARPAADLRIGPGLAKLTGADPHGVVVIRHGVLVYEQYFVGDDMRGWRPLGVVPHDANTLHNIQSITKSVVALLVGVAFDRGWLKDLDAPIFSFFPEYADLRTLRKIGLHCVICCR